MRILPINKFFYLKGGSEKYFFDLSELLERKGHHVYVFSTQHPKNYRWPDSDGFVKYFDYSKREGFFKDFRKVARIFWNFEAKSKLNQLLAEKKPDIAHLHNIFHHFSPSIIAALKKANIPIVMTLHDYKLFCPNYKFYSQGRVCYDCLKKKNYRSCISKKCVKDSKIKSAICALEGYWQRHLEVAGQIDAFICPSQFMKSKAIAAGLPKEKVFHLPNFLSNSQNLAETDNHQKGKYILYFGRLSEEKGVDVLVQAFQRIAKRHRSWKLKIAGAGPAEKSLKKLAGKDLKTARQIEFTGLQKQDKLQGLISKAYLTVVPSLWPEDYPYSVLESYLSQKPVIGSCVGGLTEMIEHELTGLLFRTGNMNELARKIEQAIASPRKIGKMGKAGQLKAVVTNNHEKHYRQLIDIYERIKTD